MSTNHKYTDKNHALYDVVLFSRLNMFEGTTLYLCKHDDVWTIETRAQHDHAIEAIALNGQLFLPA